ncbi:hypothetical protein CDN99_13585 [Roseateles aquatilis]|uniref:diguanylate cyclase n=1 Tax=Roseateles aquatilis TaxID=431061 RepID=A0A246JCL8_9BURK|nr:GGDEF domain-containing protein [Roseateles aquatilis]OWQ90383.1 hypothetical protein CDN99_13585 [Roseateles aquatilis]
MPDSAFATHPKYAELVRTLWMTAAEATPLLREEVRAATGSGSGSGSGSEIVLAFAKALLARALARSGQSEEAETVAQEALAQFRQLGSVNGEAMALVCLSLVHWCSGRQAVALEDLRRADSLSRGSTWRDLHASALNMMGIVLNDLGHHEQAAAVLEDALRAPAEQVSRPMRVRLSSNLSLALGRLAYQEKAQGAPRKTWTDRALASVALASRCLDECRRCLPSDEPHIQENLASALVVLDRLDEAHAALDAADSAAAASGNRLSEVYCAATRARAWLAADEPARAAAAAERGIQAAAAAGATIFLDELYLVSSKSWERLGDYRKSLEAHQQFFRWREAQVLKLAEERARSLAVVLGLDRAQRESRQDPLTGLANRRAFDEMLDRVLSRASPTSVIGLALIDLDCFKQVNDAHGHAVGDEALQLVAKLMVSEGRAHDLVARLGGDEFAVLVQGAPGSAQSVCQRVRARLGPQCVEHWPQGPRITLSIGIVEAREPQPKATLLQLADEALYRVKRQGRDGVSVAGA